MNFQSWRGVEDPKFGYGSMLAGFRGAVPDGVSLSEKASVDVYMGVPFAGGDWLKGQHRVCFTMWETDRLPHSFVRSLGWYDQVLVPCQNNVELFSRYHSDVQMVPLGVDTDFWKPQAHPTGRFKFIAGGSLWYRKGLDVLVKAFERLDLRDAELHIKAAPHAFETPQVNHPRIFLHRQWMTLEQQRDWYAQGHVYVAPARGEGFGLMPLQAMAMGIPTIVSLSTGQNEFARLATGQVPCSKSSSPAGGRWDEPHLKALMNRMMEHYENWNLVRQQALDTVGKVADFSWVNATNKLLNAVPEGKQLTTRTRIPAPTETTVTMKHTVKADIHKKTWNLEKGGTYTIPDGVYQVLFDANALEV